MFTAIRLALWKWHTIFIKQAQFHEYTNNILYHYMHHSKCRTQMLGCRPALLKVTSPWVCVLRLRVYFTMNHVSVHSNVSGLRVMCPVGEERGAESSWILRPHPSCYRIQGKFWLDNNFVSLWWNDSSSASPFQVQVVKQWRVHVGVSTFATQCAMYNKMKEKCVTCYTCLPVTISFIGTYFSPAVWVCVCSHL